MGILEEAQSTIATREELVAFLSLLRQDLAQHGEQWENSTLESYLEALQAVLTDWRGRFANRGEIAPDVPSWRLVAEILLAASVYE
ncbi:MAG TPA: hypothetical protein VGF69_17585 [Thermoanaerobaculia bacterium]|jgi:hypothetical protein